MKNIVEINSLTKPVTPVGIESLPQTERQAVEDATWMTDERKSSQFMRAMDIYLERGAQADCAGVASELTDGVCPVCGAEDLPW